MSGAVLLSSIPGAKAQSPGDLFCYYLDSDGTLYDLGSLCGGDTPRSGAPVSAPTPPIPSPSSSPTASANQSRITLSWNTIDDLDLSVQEPSGERISWGQPNSSSGGRLLRDANAACIAPTPNATEEITWASRQVPSGEYRIRVFMPIPCQRPPVPVSFVLQVNINGTEASFPGTVSPTNALQEFRVQVP